MSKPSYLAQRGRQWYFRTSVPRALYQLFGQQKITIPLGDSPSAAEREGAHLLAACKGLFARAAVMTPEAVAAELKALRHMRGPDTSTRELAYADALADFAMAGMDGRAKGAMGGQGKGKGGGPRRSQMER